MPFHFFVHFYMNSVHYSGKALVKNGRVKPEPMQGLKISLFFKTENMTVKYCKVISMVYHTYCTVMYTELYSISWIVAAVYTIS